MVVGGYSITTVPTAGIIVTSSTWEDEVRMSVTIIAWLRLVHPRFVVVDRYRLQAQFLAN